MKSILKKAIAEAIIQASGLEADQVLRAIEKPRNIQFGDLAFPCFSLVKTWGIAPDKCAEKLASSIVSPAGIKDIKAVGPFLNFSFEREGYTRHVFESVFLDRIESKFKDNSQDTILVEYSSPNIAKPFHVGHLRATLLGNSLDRVYRFLGFRVVSINHLGDWGTQFGFVWAGCKLWGKPEKGTVSDLVELYRQATTLKEAQEKKIILPEDEAYPDVNQIARQYFLDLERGEPYAKVFWQWCLDISLEYLKNTYQRLGVHFDHYTGESFYSNRLEEVRQDLVNANLLQESEGAIGIDLREELGFARIFTPDGRSLYLTRDLAAVKYRDQTFHFKKAIYVVGMPQTLHFRQLIAILRKLNHPAADKLIHVAFGLVLGMKTRGKGEFIELNDFIDEAIERSLTAYREQVSKRPVGLDEQNVAQAVALSAIIFSTLSQTRTKDVHFDWRSALEFQGDTGPYLLYAYARINGIKEKAGQTLQIPQDKSSWAKNLNTKHFTDNASYHLISVIGDFEEVLAKTTADNEGKHLAEYALLLAKTFSKVYTVLKVVGESEELGLARLALFEATKITLGTALQLLGIQPLERM